jgi:hypothetical protein
MKYFFKKTVLLITSNTVQINYNLIKKKKY